MNNVNKSAVYKSAQKIDSNIKISEKALFDIIESNCLEKINIDTVTTLKAFSDPQYKNYYIKYDIRKDRFKRDEDGSLLKDISLKRALEYSWSRFTDNEIVVYLVEGELLKSLGLYE